MQAKKGIDLLTDEDKSRLELFRAYLNGQGIVDPTTDDVLIYLEARYRGLMMRSINPQTYARIIGTILKANYPLIDKDVLFRKRQSLRKSIAQIQHKQAIPMTKRDVQKFVEMTSPEMGELGDTAMESGSQDIRYNELTQQECGQSGSPGCQPHVFVHDKDKSRKSVQADNVPDNSDQSTTRCIKQDHPSADQPSKKENKRVTWRTPIISAIFDAPTQPRVATSISTQKLYNIQYTQRSGRCGFTLQQFAKLVSTYSILAMGIVPAPEQQQIVSADQLFRTSSTDNVHIDNALFMSADRSTIETDVCTIKQRAGKANIELNPGCEVSTKSDYWGCKF